MAYGGAFLCFWQLFRLTGWKHCCLIYTIMYHQCLVIFLFPIISMTCILSNPPSEHAEKLKIDTAAHAVPTRSDRTSQSLRLSLRLRARDTNESTTRKLKPDTGIRKPKEAMKRKGNNATARSISPVIITAASVNPSMSLSPVCVWPLVYTCTDRAEKNPVNAFAKRTGSKLQRTFSQIDGLR